MADGLRVVGVVPASGASRRMGRPKGTLRLDGRSFLERVTRALRDGGCDRVVVVVAEDEPEVREEAGRLPVDVLVNAEPGDGPLTSMRLALEGLDDAVDAIAWLPLDFPLVRAADVRRLLDEAASTGAPLTLPVHRGKRGHPPVFHRSLFGELLDPALEGGARTVVHRHLDRAVLVAFDDPGVVVDVDTPDAYARLLERHESGVGG